MIKKTTSKTSKKRTKGETTKRVKRKKAPGEPKRSLTAFMLFSQAKRAKVKSDNPEASFGEMGKLLGELWKKAKPDEKKNFKSKPKLRKRSMM